MKIALAQINPTVGDFQGNTKKIIEFAQEAFERPGRYCHVPGIGSLRLPSRPTSWKKPSFVARAGEAIAEIAATATTGRPLTIICGYVTEAPQESGKHVVNSAALLRNGAVEFVQSKRLLPFDDVFDEQRVLLLWGKPEPSTPWVINAWPSPSVKMPGTISCSGPDVSTPLIRSRS